MPRLPSRGIFFWGIALVVPDKAVGNAPLGRAFQQREHAMDIWREEAGLGA